MEENTFGNRLRERRENLNLTQHELVNKLRTVGIEVGRSYVSEMERNNKIPNGNVVAGLAVVLGVTTDWLLLGNDQVVHV